MKSGDTKNFDYIVGANNPKKCQELIDFLNGHIELIVIDNLILKNETMDGSIFLRLGDSKTAVIKF